MCLVALSCGQSERFPLVIASNRDEFFARSSEALAWWAPGHGAPEILGGRDLAAGGAWLALSRAGRLALLTNVRQPDRNDPTAPTRGAIVTGWLAGTDTADAFCARTARAGHNGYNLIVADLPSADWCWATNAPQRLQLLTPGLYGLSNAGLDTPWPKVELLKRHLRVAVEDAADAEQLCDRLLHALADREPVPDRLLPSTGIALEWERALAPAFIHAPQRGYGTRCSTLVISEQLPDRRRTHVIERSFDGAGRETGTRRVLLPDWPAALAPSGAPQPAHSARVIST